MVPDGAAGFKIRPTVKLTATVDHRFVDGAHLGKLGNEVVRLLENPIELL